MDAHAEDVWITGVGLVSSIGADNASHASATADRRIVDESRFAPYPVHPLVALDLSRQIPKNSDQRQMEAWQRIGVYAAGLALEDAGLSGQPALLDSTDLIVAAGSGERDSTVDQRILAADREPDRADLLANEILPGALRPTLFLAQLSNLLAGNISIVHHLTGSSRTFMGEEAAGLSAVENAFRRVRAGQSNRCLVGGALNAEREDLLLGYELGHNLWSQPFQPIAARSTAGGGFVPGSVGAFLLVESARVATARAARPYCRIASVATMRCDRSPGAVGRTLSAMIERDGGGRGSGGAAVYSGASGVEPITREEFAALATAALPVWSYGDLIGHGVEAHFPAGIALAALALRDGRTLPAATGGSEAGPLARVLVTGVGHWRGEGLAVLDSAQ